MAALENKIDFAVVFASNNANPNGDPLNGNRPRTTSEGLGEVSDVALKRKIRNRLQDAGETIFVQSDDRSDDGAKSLFQHIFENLAERRAETEEPGVPESVRTVA